MAKKQRRSRDGGPDRPERFPDYIPYQRRESEPVPEGTPHLETQSSPSPIDDAAAVEAARARALAVNAERHEPEEEEKNAMVEFAKTAGSYTASVGKGGVKVAVQAVGMMG
ncbi:hypothetical protein HY630_03485, partial [Candidatus Uhrbacteria bacterium]|nr:hypothetical protein [Candidatus Uhrbacteria bacterium]